MPIVASHAKWACPNTHMAHASDPIQNVLEVLKMRREFVGVTSTSSWYLLENLLQFFFNGINPRRALQIGMYMLKIRGFELDSNLDDQFEDMDIRLLEKLAYILQKMDRMGLSCSMHGFCKEYDLSNDSAQSALLSAAIARLSESRWDEAIKLIMQAFRPTCVPRKVTYDAADLPKLGEGLEMCGKFNDAIEAYKLYIRRFEGDHARSQDVIAVRQKLLQCMHFVRGRDGIESDTHRVEDTVIKECGRSSSAHQ